MLILNVVIVVGVGDRAKRVELECVPVLLNCAENLLANRYRHRFIGRRNPKPFGMDLMEMICGDDIERELSLRLGVPEVVQNGLYLYVDILIAQLKLHGELDTSRLVKLGIRLILENFSLYFVVELKLFSG